MFFKERSKLPHRDCESPQPVVAGPDSRRSRLAVHQRDLAEVITGSELATSHSPDLNASLTCKDQMKAGRAATLGRDLVAGLVLNLPTTAGQLDHGFSRKASKEIDFC